MLRWLDHAFWYTLIALFAASLALALLGALLSLLASLVTIVVSLPKATRYWLRRRRS